MVNNGCPLCGTGVEHSCTALLALQSPRVGVGACDAMSALGHAFLSMVSDEPGLRRAKGAQKTTQAPRIPTRESLDPVQASPLSRLT